MNDDPRQPARLLPRMAWQLVEVVEMSNEDTRKRATEEIWRLLKIVERGEPISWYEAEDCTDRILALIAAEKVGA